MSRKKTSEEYANTLEYKFKQWYKGEKDPYIGTLELKKQEEYIDTPEMKEQRAKDEKTVREKVYDLDNNKMLTAFKRLYTVAAVVLCLIIVTIMVLCVSYLPPVGDSSNPTNNEVVERYVAKGTEETGVVNTVTGMILNYRGFDTFGETCVLFIASSCVMILLMVAEEKLEDTTDEMAMEVDDPILKFVAFILTPILFIFGIYVILNGHLSPGGGFSGGAIIGSGLILYSSAYGIDGIRKFFNEHVYKCIKITALMLYGCTMLYYFFTGANGLTNIFGLGTPGNIISSGMILFINIFVGSEVACTIYSFYALFKRGGL